MFIYLFVSLFLINPIFCPSLCRKSMLDKQLHWGGFNKLISNRRAGVLHRACQSAQLQESLLSHQLCADWGHGLSEREGVFSKQSKE